MIAKKDVIDVRRCVIIGGAEIRTYDRVRQYFRPDDFFIYCDCFICLIKTLKMKKIQTLCRNLYLLISH